MTPREAISRLDTLGLVIDQAMAECGQRAVELVHEGFDRNQDPYGVPWRMRKKDLTPAHRSREFRNSFTVENRHLGFVLRSSHVASVYQNFGTSTGVLARPTVPDDRGLPKRWADEFTQIVSERIKNHLGS